MGLPILHNIRNDKENYQLQEQRHHVESVQDIS